MSVGSTAYTKEDSILGELPSIFGANLHFFSVTPVKITASKRRRVQSAPAGTGRDEGESDKQWDAFFVLAAAGLDGGVAHDGSGAPEREADKEARATPRGTTCRPPRVRCGRQRDSVSLGACGSPPAAADADRRPDYPATLRLDAALPRRFAIFCAKYGKSGFLSRLRASGTRTAFSHTRWRRIMAHSRKAFPKN